jgi:hypothetical protein
VLARWPKTLRLEIGRLGAVLFCHATPHSETEVFTRLTPADRLAPLLNDGRAAFVLLDNLHLLGARGKKFGLQQRRPIGGEA